MGLKTGQSAVIISVDAGSQAAKRLSDLGLTPRTPVRILRRTLFFGPIEIEARGCKLAIGRGLASKVWVKKI